MMTSIQDDSPKRLGIIILDVENAKAPGPSTTRPWGSRVLRRDRGGAHEFFWWGWVDHLGTTSRGVDCAQHNPRRGERATLRARMQPRLGQCFGTISKKYSILPSNPYFIKLDVQVQKNSGEILKGRITDFTLRKKQRRGTTSEKSL